MSRLIELIAITSDQDESPGLVHTREDMIFDDGTSVTYQRAQIPEGVMAEGFQVYLPDGTAVPELVREARRRSVLNAMLDALMQEAVDQGRVELLPSGILAPLVAM